MKSFLNRVPVGSFLIFSALFSASAYAGPTIVPFTDRHADHLLENGSLDRIRVRLNSGLVVRHKSRSAEGIDVSGDRMEFDNASVVIQTRTETLPEKTYGRIVALEGRDERTRGSSNEEGFADGRRVVYVSFDGPSCRSKNCAMAFAKAYRTRSSCSGGGQERSCHGERHFQGDRYYLVRVPDAGRFRFDGVALQSESGRVPLAYGENLNVFSDDDNLDRSIYIVVNRRTVFR